MASKIISEEMKIKGAGQQEATLKMKISPASRTAKIISNLQVQGAVHRLRGIASLTDTIRSQQGSRPQSPPIRCFAARKIQNQLVKQSHFSPGPKRSARNSDMRCFSALSGIHIKEFAGHDDDFSFNPALKSCIPFRRGAGNRSNFAQAQNDPCGG